MCLVNFSRFCLEIVAYMQKILGLLYSLLSSVKKNNVICHFQFATKYLVVFVPFLVLMLLGGFVHAFYGVWCQKLLIQVFYSSSK